jgi:hypothetical protein
MLVVPVSVLMSPSHCHELALVVDGGDHRSSLFVYKH